MLLVLATPGPSSISGIGLFAAEFIHHGMVVGRFGACDISLSKENVEKLPEPLRSEILSLYFSFVSKETGNYVMPGDDARYMNHSKTPNVVLRARSPGIESDEIAARDILPGEEITIDYEAFAIEGTNWNE